MTINDLEISKNGIISTKKNYALKCYEEFSSENTDEYLKVMVSIANSSGGFIVFGAETKNNRSKFGQINNNLMPSIEEFVKKQNKHLDPEYMGSIRCLFSVKEQNEKRLR